MFSTEKDYSYYIGIDEAGRGPLAGPVAVGAICAKKRIFKEPFLKEIIKDSKQLSAQKRREIFNIIKKEAKMGNISFTYSLIGSQEIDKKGIQHSVYIGIKRCLNRLCILPEKTLILLDGSLYAPKKYEFQQTIIRGDEKESLIALASIIAKVIRDQKMEQFAEKYPEYLFDQHKGYGTKLHLKKIKKHGPTQLHRKSYLS